MLEWASFRLVFMSLWYHINVLSSESLESSFLLGWFWHQCVTYLIGLYGNKLGWAGLLHSYVLHIYLFDEERNKHTGSGCGHNIWQKKRRGRSSSSESCYFSKRCATPKLNWRQFQRKFVEIDTQQKKNTETNLLCQSVTTHMKLHLPNRGELNAQRQPNITKEGKHTELVLLAILICSFTEEARTKIEKLMF